MNKNERLKIILEKAKKGQIKASDFEFLGVERTTLFRDFKSLTSEGKIEEIKKGIYQIKIDPKKYFLKDVFEREPKKYNFDFLNSYIPNKTSFLGDGYKKISKHLKNNILSTYDYKVNIKSIENLLIDLSFASSKLEGNKYSYLDTEMLIKYETQAEGSTKTDTQMILNHKHAIKYIIDNRSNIKLSKMDFQNIHTILGKGLIHETYLGKFRNDIVTIGGTSYTPLGNKNQIEEQFNLFIEKLNKIKNPFEQSLFILVFIPYFQSFIDINKRTSRIGANIPLIKNGLTPFSLLQIGNKEYVIAYLAIYELNDTSLLRDLFIDNYLLNLKRYK